MKTLFPLLLAITLTACSSSPKTKSLTLQLKNKCELCGTDLIRILGTRSGVEKIALDYQSRLQLKYNPQQTSPEALAWLLDREGYTVEEVGDEEDNSIPTN